MKTIKDFINKLRGKQSPPYYRSLWNGGTSGYSINELIAVPVSTSSNNTEEKKLDERIDKKPAEVFEEILSVEPIMNLVGLDRQIELVKRRRDFLKLHLNQSCVDEDTALAFLEARKKISQYQNLFNWGITTQSKIDALCKKYKVKEVGFDSFFKNIPMEAIDELEKFCEAYTKVRPKKDMPYLRLIIDDGGKETKKDPILLAGSPFGKWYYVLGAWDKEVEIVDDLLYNKN